jgi:hypothetical protein
MIIWELWKEDNLVVGLEVGCAKAIYMKVACLAIIVSKYI